MKQSIAIGVVASATVIISISILYLFTKAENDADKTQDMIKKEENTVREKYQEPETNINIPPPTDVEKPTEGPTTEGPTTEGPTRGGKTKKRKNKSRKNKNKNKKSKKNKK